jgi:hypothetical protein
LAVPALRLEVTDRTDVDHWRWVLKDAGGAFLADHSVALDRNAPEYRALYDLPGHLEHYAAPDSREDEERRLLQEFGAWLGKNVLGESIGNKIIKHGLPPVIVRVFVPSSADQLFVLPLELAHAGGRSVVAHGASLIFEVANCDSFSVAPVRDQLRILALFSLPPSDSPLNLRRERQMLQSLVRRLTGASGLSVELRVMQYGVTRQSLRTMLTIGNGWDVIHFSGHGLPGLLTLEKPDGTADQFSSTELADLLRDAGQRLKLVVLSACHSAAASIEQTLNWLGIVTRAAALPGESERAGGTETSKAAPIVARALISSLGCAVVAMRYAVEDEFAAAFGVQHYDALIERQQLLPRAVQIAVEEALARGPTGPLSSATPTLFGASAPDLQLVPPPRQKTFALAETGLAYFDPEPTHFVGRVSSMTLASAALAIQSDKSGVLFHGMAGAGKTSCAVELAYNHQHASRFLAFVWYRAPEQGRDISLELRNFAVAMETQLPDFAMMPVVSDQDALERWIPKLKQKLATHAVLICWTTSRAC